MPNERFKLIPSVYMILVKDDKTLLARRFNTGFQDGNYGLVSGHAEGRATLREELAREVREETGILVLPTDMRHVLTMHRWCGDHERADFFFEVKKWSGEIKNTEPNKCDDISWFLVNDLPQNTIDYIREVYRCYQAGITYSEFGWPQK